MIRVLVSVKGVVLMCVCCFIAVSCDVSAGGSMEKVLQEVDRNLTHRPPRDRVPHFMRELYLLMKDETENILSSQAGGNPYRNSPAVKSFRARSKHGTKFKFKIPDFSNVYDISGAQLMVKTNSSTVRAKYRHRLLNGSEATLSELYYAFNVTESVLSHGYNQNTNISFHIFDAGQVSTDDVYLILYEHITADRLHHSRRKRSFQTAHLHFIQSFLTNDTSRVHGDDCQRADWTVDFEDLGWFWIMEPLTVQVGQCLGSCSMFSTNPNITNHAFLKTIINIQRHGEETRLPSSSCTPVEYAPLMLLYFDASWNTYTRLLPEFTVTGCGCR